MKRLAVFLLFVAFVATRAVAASSACLLVPRSFAAPFVVSECPVNSVAAFAGETRFDGNGNQTQKRSTTAAKSTTTRDQLEIVSVNGGTVAQFQYDDLGRRIQKNSEYEHWDGRSLAAETDATSGGILRSYTHGLALLRENVLGNIVETYTDALGSVRETRN